MTRPCRYRATGHHAKEACRNAAFVHADYNHAVFPSIVILLMSLKRRFSPRSLRSLRECRTTQPVVAFEQYNRVVFVALCLVFSNASL